MNLILKSLTFSNFKGIKSLEINFNPTTTNIIGDNGTFKSSIFDGYTWLLFGKDQFGRTDNGKGRFEVKPLDGNNNPIHRLDSVVIGLFSLDGSELTLKRVYREKWTKKRGSEESELTGHETDFYYNDVPLKKGEYESKIASIIHEETFKMLSDPYRFCTLPWLTQREILISMIGGVSGDLKIMESNDKFQPLIAKITNKTVKEYQTQVKEIIKNLKQDKDKIPVRIDEVVKNTPEALNYTEIETQVEQINSQIRVLEEKLSGIASSHKEHYEQKSLLEKDLYSIKSKMSSIEIDARNQISRRLSEKEENIKSVERDIKKIQDSATLLASDLKGEENNIKLLELRKTEIQSEWKNEPKTISFDNSNTICPTCDRKFDDDFLNKKKEDVIASFNTRLQLKMKNLVSEGNTINQNIKDKQAKIEDLQTEIEQALEMLASKRTELEEARNTPCGIRTSQSILDENAEYLHLKTALANIESQISEITSAPKQSDNDLIEEKSKLIKDRDLLILKLNTKTEIDRSQKRIRELEQEEGSINAQISEYEKYEFLIEEFIRLKVDVYEKPINALFENVKFKLFDVQLNGGINEICEAMVNGVPWTLANTAAKVQTGIEIINRLADFNNTYTPFFIDGRESVVQIPQTKSQVINLIVKEGVKPLKIENNDTK